MIRLPLPVFILILTILPSDTTLANDDIPQNDVAGSQKPLLLERPDKTIITYYLQFAGPEAADTVLVILQGGDCNSVAHIRGITALRQVLPNADLLTVEKIGIDATLPYHRGDMERDNCPELYLARDRPSQRVDDVVHVLDHVKRQHGYTYVVLVGASEGAVIASLLLARGVAANAAILLNGGGRWSIDDFVHNLRFQDKTSSEIDADVAATRAFAKYIMEGPPFEIEFSNHGYAYWREMFAIDQQEALMKSTIPTVIIQSGMDQIVSPEMAVEMVETLRREGKTNIELVFLEELNHTFQNREGDNKISEVVVKMREWLQMADSGDHPLRPPRVTPPDDRHPSRLPKYPLRPRHSIVSRNPKKGAP